MEFDIKAIPKPSNLLTMSSPQVSSSDTQLSKLRIACNFNELQEVTTCTKETVRITPPLHNGVIQKPVSIIKDENVTPNEYCMELNDMKHRILKKNSSKGYNTVDKCCQTEEIEYEKPGTHEDQYSFLRYGEPESANSNTNTNADFISIERDQDSKNRSCGPIEVIVSENKFMPNNEENDAEKRADPNSISPLSLNQKSEESEKKVDEDEDEEDSCGVKCCIFALNVCECVIM